jgi:hypothetical protein
MKRKIKRGDVFTEVKGSRKAFKSLEPLQFELTVICIEAAEGCPTNWSIFWWTELDYLREHLPAFLERCPDKPNEVYDALAMLDLGFSRSPVQHAKLQGEHGGYIVYSGGRGGAKTAGGPSRGVRAHPAKAGPPIGRCRSKLLRPPGGSCATAGSIYDQDNDAVPASGPSKATVRRTRQRGRIMQYRNSDSDDDHYIGGYAVEADVYLKIGNRSGSKILTLDRWIELCWPDGEGYPVPPQETGWIIDREIGGAK